MQTKQSFFKKHQNTFIIIATIVLLITSRLGWLYFFSAKDSPKVVNGTIDLTNVEFNSKEIISLDGEWEFYPNSFIIDEQYSPSERKLLTVPGEWNDFTNNEKQPAYSYGSYRLLLKLPPNKKEHYSIRVPSVRSSSQLFINGDLIKQSGQPAKTKQNYIPENKPYTANLYNDGHGQFEIIVQATNFKDTRSGGIIRSISFGTNEAINHNTLLSINMQYILAATFLLHALYASILFIIGNRDPRLLYFSLLTFVTILVLSLTNDDKILLTILPINYDWSFKLTHIMFGLLVYSLVKLISYEFNDFWREKVVPYFTIATFITILVTAILPMEYIFFINQAYVLLALFTFASSFYILITYSLKVAREKVYILISIFALFNHLLWSEIYRHIGVKTIYYPVDLIVTIVAITMVWLHYYYQSYQQLETLTEKMQQADHLKNQFLAQTSHELRNPLHGIINISEAILEKERQNITNKSRQNLQSVITVGRKMSYILNDLLEVMHLKDKNIHLYKNNVNLYSLTKSILQMLQFMTDKKPITIINNIQQDFPLVKADETRLTQILFNLLHNAIKFTNEGYVEIKATIKGEKAIISITDTGVGISEEQLNYIFEPYEQINNDGEIVNSGFGLGLAITKQLVQLHDSQLLVESTVNKGSTFTFALDISKLNIENADEYITTRAKKLTTASIDQDHQDQVIISEKHDGLDQRPRILAVDDDLFNLSVLENILPASQYEIVTVADAEEALRLIDEEHWHLVISDIMMPNISGYDLTTEIRKRFSLLDLPIILLTALSSTKEVERGFLVGANDFVAKPIDAAILKSRVKALTDVQLLLAERLQIESALLQAQIQPHFLFNTLNSIAALSQIDNERMLRLLNELSNYLRASFDFHNTEQLVPIKHELNLCQSYLYIEKERFQEKLVADIIVPDNIQLYVPPLTIQPLVENAVKHGIMKKTGPGKVTIKIVDHDEYYEIRVEDNGVGIDSKLVDELLESNFKAGTGIGLKNTHKRLLKTFGTGLNITSEKEVGTIVSFKVNKN